MKKNTSGFSLVEVVVALSIAAFSLISILGLIPVGLNLSAVAKRQTEAVSILSSVTADLRSVPLSGTASPRYNIGIAPVGSQTLYFAGSGGGSGKYSTAVESDSLYRVVLTPYTPAGRRATWVDVCVSWPAMGNSSNPQGVIETAISLDRN